MSNLTVLAVEVEKAPEMKTIPDTLEALQELVGGYLEVVRISEDILLIVNEEGMLMDLPVNFTTIVIDNGIVKPVHRIHGNVFFVSSLGEEFQSLDKMQARRIKRMFERNRDYCIVAER